MVLIAGRRHQYGVSVTEPPVALLILEPSVTIRTLLTGPLQRFHLLHIECYLVDFEVSLVPKTVDKNKHM